MTGAEVLITRPWQLVRPETAAPGRVEEAVGLVLAHVFPLQARQQRTVLTYLLEPGVAPAPAVRAAEYSGVSPSRVRQLVRDAAGFARTVPPPASLLEALRLLQDGGIRTSREVTDHLYDAGLTVDRLPVRVLLRIAGMFELPGAGTPQLLGPGDTPEASTGAAADTAGQDHGHDHGHGHVDSDAHAPGRSSDHGHGQGHGRGHVRGRGDDYVAVVPAREHEQLRFYLDGPHRSLRHQIAVPVLRSDLEGLAGTAPGEAVRLRGSEAGLAAVIATHRPLRLHRAPGVGPEAGWWVWRRWDMAPRQRGVSVRLVQRLLAVRPFTDENLHGALVEAIANLPPSQRYGATVPPTSVLSAWLDDVAAVDDRLSLMAGARFWDLPQLDVDRHFSDVFAHCGEGVDGARLQSALIDRGYSRASAKALLHTSPILRRMAAGRYQLR